MIRCALTQSCKASGPPVGATEKKNADGSGRRLVQVGETSFTDLYEPSGVVAVWNGRDCGGNGHGRNLHQRSRRRPADAAGWPETGLPLGFYVAKRSLSL